MWNQNTCCYIYLVKLDEVRLGLNIIWRQGNFEKVCSHHEHKVCAPCKTSYKNITCLWESIVCPKGDFDEWYKKECLYGNCSTCGERKLRFCSKELNGIDECPIQWRHYALEEIGSKNGKPLKELTLAYKNTYLDEFIGYFKPKLQLFVKQFRG